MSKKRNSERYLPSHTLIEHYEILHLLVFILFNFPHFFFQTGDGLGSGQAWGCDLSYDYVKINAEYTT